MPDTPAPDAVLHLTALQLGLAGLAAVVLLLVAFRVGRWLGFRQFQRAYAAALQGFADETVRRERVWQSRLDLNDQTHTAKAAMLDQELAEARAAEQVFRRLAARYQGWLEGRRWLVLPPQPDDLRLARLLREHDELVEASARLVRAARRAAGRGELPVDVREGLRACVDDPAFAPGGGATAQAVASKAG